MRRWQSFSDGVAVSRLDVGMFFTGGMDGLVKCWDTEAETVIHNFDNKSKVHSPSY